MKKSAYITFCYLLALMVLTSCNAQQSSPQVSTTTNGSTSQPSIQQSPSSSNLRASRKPLTTVKVVRADVGENGKPSNFHFHNLTAHVNLYSEEQAVVPFILEKVNNEMNDVEELILVGANGLTIYDQEGTRGW